MPFLFSVLCPTSSWFVVMAATLSLDDSNLFTTMNGSSVYLRMILVFIRQKRSFYSTVDPHATDFIGGISLTQRVQLPPQLLLLFSELKVIRLIAEKIKYQLSSNSSPHKYYSISIVMNCTSVICLKNLSY